MSGRRAFVAVLLVGPVLAKAPAYAADWPQFLGPHGAAKAADANLPVEWSDAKNLRWKTELPGPGSSSPIVVGDRVLVTCYSGEGTSQSNSSGSGALRRHLVCMNRNDGSIRWTATLDAEQPEDGYQGYLTEHGYASSTPTSDGERVYCFFGKSGVAAFDLDGKQLWITGVGKDSSNRRWGSAASLVLHKNLVIVNASEESRSIRALDKATGKEVWKAAGSALELAYGTPSVVTLKDGSTEIVVAAPGEIWGLNPDNGKLRWYMEHLLTGNVTPSVVVDGETLYVFGGFRSSGSFSMRAGGRDDVVKTHLGWSSRNSSYVATPALHGGHLYWVDDRGQAFCCSAATGELVYRERVEGLSSGGRPVYASPIAAGDKLYVPTRWSGVLVLAAEPKFRVLAQNRFVDDETDFNASPAISDGELFLRSNRRLYCVSSKK